MSIKCPKCQTENPDTSRFCAGCGTQLTPSKDIPVSYTKTLEIPAEELSRGATFAQRYEILEKLGKGGMGSVYRVIDKQIDEEMALKILNPNIASDKSTINRFKNELKLARKITHKNVCRMHDINEDDGTFYITMEYVPGEDLKSFVKRSERLTEGKALSIAKQICEGLAEAHRIGVVHRDLKPQNIMIDKKGNAKIMDFGIARSLEARGVTEAGMIIGTPDYMSPEQVEGIEADQRSDIYSLGIILYEMVTGLTPYEGETALSIALKHKTELPPDPKDINPQISKELSRIILRCMEKDRESRYQGAEELLSDVIKIEKEIPTVERALIKKKPAKEKITKIQWKKILLYSGAAVLLALIIIGGISLFMGRAESIDSLAVLPFENADADPAQEDLIDGITVSLINNLSQLSGLKKVISSFSAFQYKGKKPDIQTVGQELKVRAILTGRISQRGDELSISAELIDTQDNSIIWGEQYNRKFSEIFAVQEDISKEISDKLSLPLTKEEEKRLTKEYTENTEAYKAYLKGHIYASKWTPAGWQKAVEFFQEAIENDPLYAPAYAGISIAYSGLGLWGSILREQAFQKAKAAAEKALEIDDSLAFAHHSLGTVKMMSDWDWEGTEAEIKRALELNPNLADAHFLSGEFYAAIKGDMDKALAEKRRARELDPLSPLMDSGIGMTLFYSRQYDQAIQEMERLLATGMKSPMINLYLWSAYAEKEQYDKAFPHLFKTLLAGQFIRDIDALEGIYEKSGYRASLLELKKILTDRSGGILPAGICARLGENDEALEYLEEAYERHSPGMVWIKVMEPALDNLHSHPRFKALLKKMRLE